MNNDYSKIIQKFEEIMVDLFEKDPDTYMDFDDRAYYEIRREDLEDNAMGRLIDYMTSDMTDAELDEFNANLDSFEERVRRGISEDFFSALEEREIERRKDVMEYQKNPLRYFGMKQSDFL